MTVRVALESSRDVREEVYLWVCTLMRQRCRHVSWMTWSSVMHKSGMLRAAAVAAATAAAATAVAAASATGCDRCKCLVLSPSPVAVTASVERPAPAPSHRHTIKVQPGDSKARTSQDSRTSPRRGLPCMIRTLNADTSMTAVAMVQSDRSPRRCEKVVVEDRVCLVLLIAEDCKHVFQCPQYAHRSEPFETNAPRKDSICEARFVDPVGTWVGDQVPRT